MKKWMQIAIACVLFAAFWFGYDLYLSGRIDSEYKQQALSNVYGDPVKDGGIVSEQIGAARGNLMVFGSSELSVHVFSNPRNFFPIEDVPHYADIYGKGYAQCLEHALNIDALPSDVHTKVVIMLSIQWFFGNGVVKAGFAGNFSPLKYDNYMLDPAVPSADKRLLSEHVYSYLLSTEGIKIYPSLLTARIMAGDGVPEKLLRPFANGFMFAQKLFESTKNKEKLLETMRPMTDQPRAPQAVDWAAEQADALAAAKADSTNNDLYVNDGYYTQYVAPALAQPDAGSLDKDIRLDVSPEYDDYKLLLSACKHKGIKPLIVIVSLNGYFYDTVGLDKAKRDAYYEKVAAITKSYGFESYNMRSMEYVPYTYTDIMHLGGSGWLDVDQKIAEYFGKDF